MAQCSSGGSGGSFSWSDGGGYWDWGDEQWSRRDWGSPSCWDSRGWNWNSPSSGWRSGDTWKNMSWSSSVDTWGESVGSIGFVPIGGKRFAPRHPQKALPDERSMRSKIPQSPDTSAGSTDLLPNGHDTRYNEVRDILDTMFWDIFDGTQAIENHNRMVVDEIDEIIKMLGDRIRQAQQRLQDTHMNRLYGEAAESRGLSHQWALTHAVSTDVADAPTDAVDADAPTSADGNERSMRSKIPQSPDTSAGSTDPLSNVHYTRYSEVRDILDTVFWDIFDGTQTIVNYNRMVVDEIEEIIETLGDRIRQAQQMLQEIHMNRLYREAAESRGLIDQTHAVSSVAETPDLRNQDPWSVGVTYEEITYRMIMLNSKP